MSDLLIVLPDIEQIVIQFLLAQPELSGLDSHIYSELPKAKTFPALRVHQFNDVEASSPLLWLMRTSLQIDVWGGSKKTTRTLADTTRALLKYRLVGVHDEGVVTGVDVSGLDTTGDDTEVPTGEGRARPRCRFDVTVWAHPVLPSGS